MASVRQHGNRWRVRWRNDTGRQVYESFPTEAEAWEHARKVEARTVLDGRAPDAVDPDELTLARWWDRWEAGRDWRQSTRETHAVHWRRYIKPVFGHMALRRITTADVRQFHRKLEARKLAPRTVAAIHRTLSMVLQGAVEDELIARNPARTAKLRRPVTHAPVALDQKTVDELLAAIATTAPDLAVFGRLIAATGLRRAEAAGLTWDRVDLDAGVILIDRQLNFHAAVQPAWSPTKTSTTRRVLLTAAMVDDLRAYRAARSVVELHGLVFTQRDGSPWPRSTLQDAWRRAADILKAAGRPLPAGARGWHSLRHTVASRLLEAGVPPIEAAQLLGHSAEMLLSTYGHVVDRSAADARLRAALE